MIDTNRIRPQMLVICSDNGQLAIVDDLEGEELIRLARDAFGLHHYIPLDWVTDVDEYVHLDRPGALAMREWSLTPPLGPACCHLA